MTLFSKLAISDSNWCSDLLSSMSQNRDKIQLISLSVFTTLMALKLYDLYDDGQFTIKSLKERSFKLMVRLPILRSIAAKELSEVNKTISHEIQKVFDSHSYITQLPQKGRKSDDIISEIKTYEELGKVNWREGRASGTVYMDGNINLTQLMTRVYDMTAYSNPLHPETFPGINKMEAEIVRMVCSLFKGDNQTCGTVTSGGTESIILAIKAYRDYGRAVKGITRPNIIVPVTAHAAFQKGTQLMGMRIKFIDLDPNTLKVDLKAMRSAITSNTVLLVGSACNFPHGIIDDIEGIAKLGLKYSIPVHVDSCLGGFLVPFMEKAGYPIPCVDFSVDGVTSISADTHKYGFAPKGSSVIMYRNGIYRTHQYSIQTDWPGGIYATPTLAGSRCGANIANCWATLLHYGYDGYVESTKKIIKTQRYLLRELKKVNGIEIMGDPLMSVVSIQSSRFNIFRVSDNLSKMGWNLNALQFPSAVHIAITLMHTQPGVIDALVSDLKTVVEECLKTPSDKSDGIGVIYGLAQSIPDRSLVGSIASQFIDGMYVTEWPQSNGK